MMHAKPHSNPAPRTVALIPARGGSKGLPGKNIKLLCGKPLIAWTIEAALQATAVERIVVSTDDAAIAAVARDYGAEVPFLRPDSLANDQAGMVDVALHFLDWLEADQNNLPPWLVLLQPTSPLRLATDIDGALAQAEAQGADAIISLFPARPHPTWTKRLNADERVTAWTSLSLDAVCRQELPPLYYPNGALYGIRPHVLKERRVFCPPNCVAWIMPESRSIDIDTAWDFHLAGLVIPSQHAFYEND